MEQNDSCDGCGLESFRHDTEIDVEKPSIVPRDTVFHREKIPFCPMNDENFMNI